MSTPSSPKNRAAYRARYGKLTPALYERLQQAKEGELLPIAVWMAPDPAARSQETIFAELVRQFPGAAEALARYGVPWRVDDATVGEKIRQAYFRALSDDALRRLWPLAEQLKGQGSEVTTLEPVPSLFARLPKSAGNDAGNVTSPGKGWNVITVGAINDQGNSNWSDDVM